MADRNLSVAKVTLAVGPIVFRGPIQILFPSAGFTAGYSVLNAADIELQLGEMIVAEISKVQVPLMSPPLVDETYEARFERLVFQSKTPPLFPVEEEKLAITSTFEIHLHKLPDDEAPDQRHRWFLTDLQRHNPPEPNPACKPNRCTILTAQLTSAEFLEETYDGEREYKYNWVDIKLLGNV